jgi:hypothetical protein
LRRRARKSAAARTTTSPVSSEGRVERPVWVIRAPNGERLEIEFDAVLRRWRVSPGEYTRRELPAALSNATGYPPQTAWITELNERLLAEIRVAARQHQRHDEPPHIG